MGREPSELIELGVATKEIKGGRMGFEDSEGTLWFKGLGLTDD